MSWRAGWCERYPKFRLRPLPSGSPFEQPVWADDPEFDLDRHLVDAGQAADDDELAALVSRLLSTPLDMHHSPWQFHVVSLPAAAGGRATSALVARLHHCIADGIALASVLLSLTDDDPSWTDRGAADRAGPDPRRPGMRTRLTAGSRDLAPVAGVDPLAPRSLRQALEAVRVRLAGPEHRRRPAAGDPRPAHPAGRPARHRTRWRPGPGRWTSGSSSGWRRLSDATVNDVLLAVTAGALRRHLAAHGDVPHDLRVFVPVDLRPRGEPVPATLGNRFGIVFVKLPLSVADPVARVRARARPDGRGEGRRAGRVDVRDPRGRRRPAVLGAPPGGARARRQVDGHRHQRAGADGAGLPGRRPPGAPDVLGAAGRLGRAGRQHPELRRRRDDRRGRGPQPGARPAGAGRGRGGRAGRPGAGHAGRPRRRRTARRGAVRLRARAVAGRRGPAGVRTPVRRPGRDADRPRRVRPAGRKLPGGPGRAGRRSAARACAGTATARSR